MGKGRIIKARIGHEANCSSGMIAFYLIAVIGRAAFLILTIFSLGVQYQNLSRGPLNESIRRKYWYDPLWYGMALTAIATLIILLIDPIGWWSLGMVLLILTIPFVLSISVSYYLMPRAREPFFAAVLAFIVFGLSTMALPFVWGLF